MERYIIRMPVRWVWNAGLWIEASEIRTQKEYLNVTPVDTWNIHL